MARRRKKQPAQEQKPEETKRDHHVHPEKTSTGKGYIFTDKHHHPCKGNHACWLKEITREIEFGLFRMADDLKLSDEDGNLYNVYRDDKLTEYYEIGTRQELLAIFWNPGSVAEWHGHPMWPIRVRGDYNRKNQQYRPPKSVMERMVQEKRMSERDAVRVQRGDYP